MDITHMAHKTAISCSPYNLPPCAYELDCILQIKEPFKLRQNQGRIYKLSFTIPDDNRCTRFKFTKMMVASNSLLFICFLLLLRRICLHALLIVYNISL